MPRIKPPPLIDRIRARLARVDRNRIRLGPCLVLGSAPSPTLPAGRLDDWELVTVNASQCVPLPVPLPGPRLTVISGQLLGEQPVNLEAQQVLAGRSTQTLILIERRDMDRQRASERLQTIDYRYEELQSITHWQRAWITHHLLGEHLATASGPKRKISTGLFAIILARFFGAPNIVVSGFSLKAEGHSYNQQGRERQHQEIDRSVLRMMAQRGWPVATTEADLAEQTGIALHAGVGS